MSMTADEVILWLCENKATLRFIPPPQREVLTARVAIPHPTDPEDRIASVHPVEGDPLKAVIDSIEEARDHRQALESRKGLKAV